MARVRHMTQTYNNSIKRFLGVNESPTGDNDLKNGEAVEMENYRVTLDGKLERRPAFLLQSASITTVNRNVLDMWSGKLNGTDMMVELAYGRPNSSTETATIELHAYTAGEEPKRPFNIPERTLLKSAGISVCTVPWDDVKKRGHIFGFQGKLYVLAQGKYYVWDGDLTVTQLPEVTPYVPLVVTASTPSGGGTELEGLNVLTDSYRVQFSPDGTSTDFYLPVTGNAKIEWVKQNGVETSINYSLDTSKECITFEAPPARGTNTLEVQVVCIQNADNLKQNAVTIQAVNGSFTVTAGSLAGFSWKLQQHKYEGSDGNIHTVYYPVFTWTDKTFVRLLSSVYESHTSYAGETTVGDNEYYLTYNNSSGEVSLTVLSGEAEEMSGSHVWKFNYYSGELPGSTNSSIVTNMTRSVLFNGATDGRVFLYGDDTYTCIYSGLDENGTPRADYFPAMNQANIGSSNTPIYGMVRHYNSLLAFKPDEAYRITYEAQTLSDSTVIAGFNIRPIHSAIGTVNYDQAVLVYNNPRTICHESIYEWRLSYYTSSSNRDERNAKRISDRVRKTLSKMDWENCWCFDDETEYEYWVTDGETAIINNYANDTWYIYTGLPNATKAVRFNGSLYLGGDGVHRLDKEWFSDYITVSNGFKTIRYVCTWKGACFDAAHDYLNKWVIDQYIGLLNQEDNQVTVTIETDRKSDYPERTIAADEDAATPTMHHVKIRHKAWAFSRLKLTSVENKFSTIVSIDTNYRLGTNGRRE